MPRRVCAFLATTLLIASLACFATAADTPFEFKDGDRVVLLGGGFIERLQTHGHLEAAITVGLQDKNITFRNLGWSGDTVWGDSRGVFGDRTEGFKRLVKDVSEARPTLLVICYGENEAYAGETGLADFRTGLTALLDALKPTNARVLLLGPKRHEKLGPPPPDPAKYNADLRKYNDTIAAVAQERSHAFIDLYDFHPRTPTLFEGVKVVPATSNGMHLNQLGQFQFAKELLPLCGVNFDEPELRVDVKGGTHRSRLVTIDELKVQEDRVSFIASPHRVTLGTDDLEDGWGWNSDRFIFHFHGLASGKYQLLADGRPLATANEKEWSNGQMLEVDARGQELRKIICEKNNLFFHRYRPQNETYLFLFRKHEQGNNAVEIPMFDPHIASKEREIAKLKQPVKLKVELVNVQ